MMVKIVALFLVAMAVLALFGRLRLRGLRLPPRSRGAALRAPAPVICLQCGTPIPGPGTCACGAGRPDGKG
jgi:hypothetical protein